MFCVAGQAIYPCVFIMSQISGNNAVRVMLVDESPVRAATVKINLIEAGFDVVVCMVTTAGLLHQIEQHRPDVILIDLESPGRDVLESLSIINRHNPTPVVMFSGEDHPSFIKAAVDAGVSAYTVGSYDTSKVKPVIDVAMAQFKSFQALRLALDSTRAQLDNLSVVSQAKTMLIKRHGMSEDAAHRQLRDLAMDTNQTLPQAALAVITLLGGSRPNDA
jgi:response regulator NasT